MNSNIRQSGINCRDERQKGMFEGAFRKCQIEIFLRISIYVGMVTNDCFMLVIGIDARLYNKILNGYVHL
jgi:hypothetical protein